MTQIDDQAGEPAAAQDGEGLEVQIAQELLERAKAQGVSLVGPGGLLAGVTRTVLQAAPAQCMVMQDRRVIASAVWASDRA